MSRGRPRHQSSRRRMYSPRQRDLRERRVHHRVDELPPVVDAAPPAPDDGEEFESPSWGISLSPRVSAA